MTPEQRREYRTVILGALLHDIGKYLQRGDFGGMVAGQHPQVGAVFVNAWREEFSRCVDADLLRTLVQRHHESHHFPQSLQVDALSDPHLRALARLVSRADNLASSERAPRDETMPYQPFRTTGLAPVFDRVEMSWPLTPAPRHFRQRPLTDTSEEPPIFATEGREVEQADVTEHVRAFGERFDRLREQLNWDDFDCVYTHLLSLLQACAWCLPSDTQANPPDISLYDHLRVTSAIAACLYQFHVVRGTLNDEEVARSGQTRCVLLVGDVSGIQDYLFAISTTGAGGVAKRLRARSFFVQFLSDAAEFADPAPFDLPLANLLMASGGKFYALLPLLPDTGQRLSELRQEFDDKLLQEFHGALAINLAWIDLPDADFAAGKYGAALGRLHNTLRNRKATRLAGALQGKEGWRDQFVREPFTGESVCLACSRFPARHFSQDRIPADGPDICDQCDRQLKLGRRLTTAQFISFFEGNAGDISCLGLSASLDRTPQQGAFLVVRVNNPDLTEAAHVPAVFRYLANHVPRHEDRAPRDFSEIADGGLLGILKADVDYLGQIFQEGLRRNAPQAGLDTVSRLATLSRQLDWFFSGWLEWLLATKYEDCYSVYSGGDDLLIVGPRGRTLGLAQEIREEFARYTKHPEINLSAGLAVVKPRMPLAHTVQFADEALESAKRSMRNRLCVLGQVVRWEDLPLVMDAVTFLERAEATSAFLYHLLYCAELWQQWKRTRDPLALRFQPLLAYSIARNVDRRSDLFAWASRLVGFPLGDTQQPESKIMDYLSLIVQWVLLERRGPRNAQT